jgi:hypothetical protein
MYSFFAYKMTVASKNSMLKHRNVDLNTVSLKASDCTSKRKHKNENIFGPVKALKL